MADWPWRDVAQATAPTTPTTTTVYIFYDKPIKEFFGLVDQVEPARRGKNSTVLLKLFVKVFILI